MLTDSALRSDIARVWDYVSVLNIGQAFSHPASLTASDEFKASSRDDTISYEEVYLMGLKNVDYNILLLDFSFFQFTREEDQEFRFAYYPNPFLGASDARVAELPELYEYVQEGVVNSEDYLRQVSEIRVARHPPMLRYEFSEIQYNPERHPMSHFHIGMYADWRWGCTVALTGRFFGLTILRHLYPEAWANAEGLKSGPNVISLDDELSKLRADCRALSGQHFSDAERPRLHFA